MNWTIKCIYEMCESVYGYIVQNDLESIKFPVRT